MILIIFVCILFIFAVLYLKQHKLKAVQYTLNAYITAMNSETEFYILYIVYYSIYVIISNNIYIL